MDRKLIMRVCVAMICLISSSIRSMNDVEMKEIYATGKVLEVLDEAIVQDKRLLDVAEKLTFEQCEETAFIQRMTQELVVHKSPGLKKIALHMNNLFKQCPALQGMAEQLAALDIDEGPTKKRKISRENAVFPCPNCQYPSKSKVGLTKHMSSCVRALEFQGINNGAKSKKLQTKHKCPNEGCECSYGRGSDLRRHIETCNGRSIQVRMQCSEAFNSRSRAQKVRFDPEQPKTLGNNKCLNEGCMCSYGKPSELIRHAAKCDSRSIEERAKKNREFNRKSEEQKARYAREGLTTQANMQVQQAPSISIEAETMMELEVPDVDLAIESGPTEKRKLSYDNGSYECPQKCGYTASHPWKINRHVKNCKEFMPVQSNDNIQERTRKCPNGGCSCAYLKKHQLERHIKICSEKSIKEREKYNWVFHNKSKKQLERHARNRPAEEESE